MVEITSYLPADFAALTALIGRSQEADRQLYPALLKMPSVVAGSYTEDLVRLCAGRNGIVLVARDGGEIVGCVAVHLEEDDNPQIKEDLRIYGEICDFFVSEPWRMRGVGRLLLDAAEAQMKGRGCVMLRATARALNLVAVRCFYDSGFFPAEVILAKAI